MRCARSVSSVSVCATAPLVSGGESRFFVSPRLNCCCMRRCVLATVLATLAAETLESVSAIEETTIQVAGSNPSYLISTLNSFVCARRITHCRDALATVVHPWFAQVTGLGMHGMHGMRSGYLAAGTSGRRSRAAMRTSTMPTSTCSCRGSRRTVRPSTAETTGSRY